MGLQEFRVTLTVKDGKTRFDIEGVQGEGCGPLAEALLKGRTEVEHGHKPEREIGESERERVR